MNDEQHACIVISSLCIHNKSVRMLYWKAAFRMSKMGNKALDKIIGTSTYHKCDPTYQYFVSPIVGPTKSD